MALVDDFENRYSANRVIQLTNPDLASASSKDSTRLAFAATDAEARFQVIVGKTYDSTDAAHVTYAVTGVEIMLLRYGSEPIESIESKLRNWEKTLEPLRKQQVNFVPLPMTTSNLVPSRERTDIDVRPVSDRTHLSDMIPNPPFQQTNGGRNL